MTLEEYIKYKQSRSKEKIDDFVDYLYFLMDKYGFPKSSDLYTKANISKQSWSAIISKKCNPSLSTCLKIIFTLKLNNHECKYLLKKAGYTLASSSKYSLIIRYCIENEIYDLAILNEYLTKYGYTSSLID